MRAESPLILERRGKVLEITMNRPPVNAINSELSDLMYQAFCTLRDDPELTLGLVTGSLEVGRHLEAGHGSQGTGDLRQILSPRGRTGRRGSTPWHRRVRPSDSPTSSPG